METDWAGSATLDQLRYQSTLIYRAFTVIQETGGVDGSLQNPDGTVSYPLDLFTPLEDPHSKVEGSGHAIRTDSETMSPDIVRERVTDWCRSNLGRDDVQFEL